MPAGVGFSPASSHFSSAAKQRRVHRIGEVAVRLVVREHLARRGALPAASMACLKELSSSTKAIGSWIACAVSTGTLMRPVGFMSFAKAAAGSAR
jgi:hypothetical protein